MTQQLGADAARRTNGVVRRRTRTFTRAVGHAYRTSGPPAAVREAANLVAGLAARPLHLWRERRLDHQFRLDTRADNGPWTRTVEGSPNGTHQDSVAYSPTPLHLLQDLLRRLPIKQPSQYAFIDLGCGKGRTLFVAAEYGFQPVIGVELDSRLATVAHENIEAYAASASTRTCPPTVVQCDAAEYEFPQAPAVIVLFNPFGADTLRAVLENLQKSLNAAPRSIVVAYVNPVHREVLDEFHPLRRTAEGRDWVIYRTA